jgi:F0F1-type ATP synthase assembly protein I
MAKPSDDRSAMAIAFQWSFTVMTISATMVVPGLLGYWLDQRLGTKAVFLLVGFALGGFLAARSLMRIAKQRTNANSE